MSTSNNPPKNTEKKADKIGELKTDFPLSEKDEVKAAEQKMTKTRKKNAQTKKGTQ